jgi:hypothetical protein
MWKESFPTAFQRHPYNRPNNGDICFVYSCNVIPPPDLYITFICIQVQHTFSKSFIFQSLVFYFSFFIFPINRNVHFFPRDSSALTEIALGSSVALKSDCFVSFRFVGISFCIFSLSSHSFLKTYFYYTYIEMYNNKSTRLAWMFVPSAP